MDKYECEFDTIVVGTGPAGCVTARELAHSGQRVALLSRDFPGDETVSQRPPFDRIDTLPPEANQCLQLLGLQDTFHICEPIECPGIISAWNADDPVETDFIFSEAGSAWHVYRGRFDRWLLGVANHAGAELFNAVRVQSILPRERGFEVVAGYEDVSQNWACRYLVDCTGQASFIGRMLGRVKQRFARLLACRTYVPRRTRDQDDRLWIERSESGWWYTIPACEDHLQVTYVAARQEFAKGWRTRVTENLKRTCLIVPRLRMDVEIRWQCSIADTSVLDSPASGRFLAVGDAAASLDPLAGQGLYWAIDSARRAANSILADANGNSTAIVDYAMELLQQFHRSQELANQFSLSNKLGNRLTSESVI